MDLNIHLYSLCWNEEIMLPYTLRHYSCFCSEMVFFDNGSTDRSIEIINSFPNTKIVSFETGDSMRTDVQTDLKNHAWKASSGRADYVIVCDCDELLYHDDFMGYLRRKKEEGFTVLSSIWCTMISEEIPTHDGLISDIIQFGKPYYPSYGQDYHFQKTSIFSPDDIREMNYTAGAHSCSPSGNVKFSIADIALKNLHYKWLSFDYVRKRHEIFSKRRSDINKKSGWGVHYNRTEEELRSTYENLKKEAVKVI